MDAAKRKEIQDVYVRMCRDSRFTCSSHAAAVLTGRILGVHPLEVWLAMPSIDVMDEIAAGTHPVCRPPPP